MNKNKGGKKYKHLNIFQVRGGTLISRCNLQKESKCQVRPKWQELASKLSNQHYKKFYQCLNTDLVKNKFINRITNGIISSEKPNEFGSFKHVSQVILIFPVNFGNIITDRFINKNITPNKKNNCINFFCKSINDYDILLIK